MSIDTFGGGCAQFGGIEFSGSAMDLYWDAVVRGVKKEIVEQLAWVDTEVRNYNSMASFQAIDECSGLLVSWSRAIRRAAIEKDRILRGDGINFPEPCDAGNWYGTSDEEIMVQAHSLKAALPFVKEGKRSRLLAYWNVNQWWLGPVGLAIGFVGLLLPFLG